MTKKNKLSERDNKDWEDFWKNTEQIVDKDTDNLTKKNKSNFKFDFHGYSIDEANKKVYEIIIQCYERGILELLIITGKGKNSKVEQNVYVSKDSNKLSSTIPDYIKNNPDLISKINKMRIASKDLGGEGAIIIKLKKLKNEF